MNLIKQDKRDRLYFNGYASNGLVGSIRAYSNPKYPSFLLYDYDESLAKYSKKIQELLEFLQSYFGRNVVCENRRRIYSRSPISEYGYHFKADEFSYFVRVNENREFKVYVYDLEGYNV